jgi:D-aminopeptidase
MNREIGMRRFLVVAAAAVAVFGFSGLVAAQGMSTTWIEAGRTFILGGEQTGDFLVEARNTGPVPVTVLAGEDGAERVIVTVAPGQGVEHVFEGGEAALFRNASGRRAELRIVLTREVSGLSMRYDRP